MSEPALRPLPERMRAIPTLVNKQRVYVVTDEQIREVERILATIDAQRWVPMTERVPRDGQRVIVSRDDGSRGEDWLYEGQWWRTTPLQTVTHWMPLPAAPEVE